MKMVAIMSKKGKTACTMDGIRHDQEVERWPVPNVNHEAMIEPRYQSTLNYLARGLSNIPWAQSIDSTINLPSKPSFRATVDGPARSTGWAQLS